MKIKLSDIIINKRIRKHLGDIQQLADSILSAGLLHPIVINSKNELIAGYRRIKAYELLGLDEIPCRVANNLDDILQAAKAERDENTCRLDPAPSEAVAQGEKIEDTEREEAKKRQLAELKQNRSGKFPERKNNSNGQTRDKVGQAVGLSGRSYQKAKKVVEFASEFPEYQYIIEEMDATGKIDRAAKEVNRIIKLQNRQSIQVEIPSDSPVWHGDFRIIGQKIPDNSVDLIFTDPPYGNKAIPLYRDLGKFAKRVLKPSGMCLAYTGQGTLPKVLNVLSKHLKYMWLFSIRHNGGFTQMFAYNIRNKYKPVVAFYKPPLLNWWEWVNDDVTTGKKEKDNHKWQQSLEEARYFIRYFCPDKGIVIDPFCGSGTTLVAAKQLGFRYIGIEDDKEDCQKALNRLENE